MDSFAEKSKEQYLQILLSYTGIVLCQNYDFKISNLLILLSLYKFCFGKIYEIFLTPFLSLHLVYFMSIMSIKYCMLAFIVAL